ncbi:MAG: sigma-54 dependent transcriptional regulator [Pseudomonadota bacterium]
MSKPYVLVVDDEPDIRALVKEILEDEGCEVRVAQDGEHARAALRERDPDLVLLDIWMPDIDGISFFKQNLALQQPKIPVIVMSGHGTVETAVEATRLGAYAFLEKPLSLNKLLPAVEGALAAAKTDAAPDKAAARRATLEAQLIGKSALMQHLREQIGRLAQYDMPVLLLGESGSGKGAAARYLHALSGRKGKPFVELRLAALPEASFEVMLFGQEEGAQITPGAFERAAGGTLYLANVEVLPAPLQARLVNVIRNGSLVRVRGVQEIKTSVRLVSSTRVDLAGLVEEGEFHQDLYHGLKGAVIAMPPLREHVEDVPDLLNFFVDALVVKQNLPYRHFPLPVQNRLRNYQWPGNVRELVNLVRQLLISASLEEIALEEVEALLKPALPSADNFLHEMFARPLREARDYFEKAYLEYHLQQEGGSVGRVAKIAGVERTHLYRKMRALGVEMKPGK